LVSDPDVVEADGNKPRQIELAGIGRRGDVVQIDAAQIEDQIGAFDDLARFRLRHRAGIHAGKLRMTFTDDAFFHERCNERTAQRFDRLLCLFLQAEPRNCEGGKCDYGFRLVDAFCDDRHRLL